MSDVQYTILSKILLPPISGSRPSGGVSADTDGIPSIGGENIVHTGGMIYEELKRIPISFFNYMPRGNLLRNDVLINKDGAQTGKVGLYDGAFEEAAVNEHVFILRGRDQQVLDQHYLYYCILLPKTRNKIERRITGSAQPGLNSQFVKAVDIPLRPIAKQRKIASILISIDVAIEKTSTLIDKYQKIKAGLMHDLFTRGVLPNGRLRPPREQAPELYQETVIGWIPREWELTKIGTAFDIQLGKMLNQKAKNGKSSFLYIGNKSVQWNRVDISDLDEMDFSPSEREKFLLKAEDLLVCEGGDVGRTAIWESQIENCYYQKAIHRLRPRGGFVRPRFMLRFMWYAKTNGIFENFTSQTSIAHLTQEKLGSVPMAMPTLEEQSLFIARFEGIDSLLDGQFSLLEKFRQQKLGLMQDLLTGKVPVKVGDGETSDG